MKNLVIIPSIRELKYWKDYENNAIENNYSLDNLEVLVIDEESGILRQKNDKILENVNHKFFGRGERHEWFKKLGLLNYKHLIPENNHAETSFGLLYAHYKNNYDNIIFMDDDTSPNNQNYFGLHEKLLNTNDQYKKLITDGMKWRNILKDFYVTKYYPRGYPYELRNKEIFSKIYKEKIDIVMNQGLWNRQLDLNATDILPISLNGKVEEVDNRIDDSFVIDKYTYITICSMNLSFKPEIIPSFYQFDTKRFDDIWSGIIIKKIADHLNKYISYGLPFCDHLKEERHTLKDVKLEAQRLYENELFWKVIDKIKLTKNTWGECYKQIALELYLDNNFNYLANPLSEWVRCCEKIEAIR